MHLNTAGARTCPGKPDLELKSTPQRGETNTHKILDKTAKISDRSFWINGRIYTEEQNAHTVSILMHKATTTSKKIPWGSAEKYLQKKSNRWKPR